MEVIVCSSWRRDPWDIPVIRDAFRAKGRVKLVAVPILTKEEQFVDGEELLERWSHGVGQAHAESLLIRGRIPRHLQGKTLWFPGTIRGRRGAKFIPTLEWNGEKWDFYFRSITGDMKLSQNDLAVVAAPLVGSQNTQGS